MRFIKFIIECFRFRDEKNEGVIVRLPSDYCEFIGL